MSAPAALFDAPGPRARLIQRIVALALGAALLLAGWAALTRLGERGNLSADRWQVFLTAPVWTGYILPGIQATFTAALISITLALPAGVMLALGRMAPLRPVNWLCTAIIEFFRCVPVLIMMIASFWVYSFYGVFPSRWLPLAGTVTGLVTYNSCVLAELIRSSVANLPQGQAEAGRAIGLTATQDMFIVQLPQAFRLALPALVSQLVIILKDTALGYQITYAELLRMSERIGSAYANIVPALLVAAVIFIAVNYALSALAAWTESALSRSRAPSSPAGPGRAA